MENKKLTKSSINHQVSGVCGGIAEYFNVDPTLVRLLFVLFTFAGGPGLILYIILALVLPESSMATDYGFEKAKRKNDFA
ncbi:MAG: hypothetical protein Phog2KO_22270 [Phototrophicaceae bacterium]